MWVGRADGYIPSTGSRGLVKRRLEGSFSYSRWPLDGLCVSQSYAMICKAFQASYCT